MAQIHTKAPMQIIMVAIVQRLGLQIVALQMRVRFPLVTPKQHLI